MHFTLRNSILRILLDDFFTQISPFPHKENLFKLHNQTPHPLKNYMRPYAIKKLT